VFAEPTHILNDRKIDPKKALARGGRDPIKKVFVGGLPPEFPLEDIKEYFGKFGKVGFIKVWYCYCAVALCNYQASSLKVLAIPHIATDVTAWSICVICYTSVTDDTLKPLD